jgi:predicted RNA-binding protein associated with RNAse of E/G family
MLRVAKPLWKTINGKPALLAADGFAWLQFYPASQEDANAPVGYCATAMIAPDDTIVQWYVDIIAGCGFMSASGAWHDDLYLDLVTAGQGDVELLDAEELEEALALGAVTPVQYQAAWAEARQLEPQVQALELPEVAALSNALAALRALETCDGDAPVAGYQLLYRISD